MTTTKDSKKIRAMKISKPQEIILNCKSSSGYFEYYRKYLMQLMNSISIKAIVDVAECFLRARRRSSMIFFIGNGGSAATASHFAQDLAEAGRKAKTKSFKTLSLTDNIPFITAAGNDYGYDKIFVVQLLELFKAGDVLVAISASGNSLNVIEAVKYAKEKGGTTIGLVGFDGGELLKLCDHAIHVKSQIGKYGPVEDIHLILSHMITSFLMLKLKTTKKTIREA